MKALLELFTPSQKSVKRHATKNDLAADFVARMEKKLGKAEKCQVVSVYCNRSKQMKGKK